MKNKSILALSALILFPLSWANADVSLRFDNSANNQTNGTPDILTATPGSTITLSLQLNATTERTDTVDYWLSQFSGPGAGAFSITSRDLSSSDYGDSPSSSDAEVASPTDTKNNTTNGSGSDGIPDNQLNPRNGFDLGAGTPGAGSPGGDLAAGTYLVANFMLSIGSTATPGIYDLRTFTYAGRGWSDVSNDIFDQPFTNQARILVNVVPEPSTWVLVVAGMLGGVTLRRLLRVR